MRILLASRRSQSTICFFYSIPCKGINARTLQREERSMNIQLPKKVQVAKIQGKGRGIVAAHEIHSGEVIEVCPFIALSDVDAEHVTNKSDIMKYYVLELTQIKKHVQPLGYGMLYNHSLSPNSEIEYQPGEDFITIKALNHIPAGQEITFDYNFDENRVDFLSLD
jgi:SET domain-containing protein